MAPIRERHTGITTRPRVKSSPSLARDETNKFGIEDVLGSGGWGYILRVEFKSGRYGGRKALKLVKEELQERYSPVSGTSHTS